MSQARARWRLKCFSAQYYLHWSCKIVLGWKTGNDTIYHPTLVDNFSVVHEASFSTPRETLYVIFPRVLVVFPCFGLFLETCRMRPMICELSTWFPSEEYSLDQCMSTSCGEGPDGYAFSQIGSSVHISDPWAMYQWRTFQIGKPCTWLNYTTKNWYAFYCWRTCVVWKVYFGLCS